MKLPLLALLVCAVLFFQSCSECEIITTELESDTLPVTLTCEGTFYASLLTTFNGSIQERQFVAFDKPLSNSLAISTLETLQGSSLQNTQSGYCQSAFNSNTLQYCYAYQFGPGMTNPLYVANVNPLSSQLFSEEVVYTGPVYNNNSLYAINVLTDANFLNYSILRVDETTGQTTELLSGNTTVNSPMQNDYVWSATDGADTLYFLGTTNLIRYSISSNTVTVTDIDPSYNKTNQVVYSGLEYNKNTQQLLAIKGNLSNPQPINELVSIANNGTITSLYNISSNLSTENDGMIFYPFHATAFDPCNNSYYITELEELEPLNGVSSSFLIEINLDENILNEQLIEGLLYGLEYQEN
ncbi:MAG: hypothetical protein CMC74_09480 [Flavobacteriaceae bacterium]|nr:hypothetical protein [Flavobacteriaceae bacterium]|tara:strand:+ start:733 stop:1797 length:1065 start_codon:yes stop_codon:yes gene_type:complete